MGHLSHDTKSRFDKTPREWLKVGSQINELVNEWAKRSDVVTFVGEGAGHSAPACFIPAIAEMEVNVSMAFGEEMDPAFVGDLSKRSVQFDYPVAMGAVMHEAFHAKHSTLDLLKGINDHKDKFVKGLATWFEETRIESRAVKALPDNRAFLRACALRLVIGDLKEDEDFTARGIQAFSQLILLTLARVDAGVLDAEDVEIIQDAAEKLFEANTLNTLRSIWTRAQAHNDDRNAEPLIKLAEEWVKALEDADFDPKDEDQIPDWLKELLQAMVGEGQPQDGEDGEDGEGNGPGEGGEDEQEGGSGGGGSVLDRMADATETDAQSEANEQAVQEVMEEVAKARDAAAAESKDHKEEAGKMFSRGTGPGPAYTSSRLVRERAPEPAERAAAVALGKALERARYRDRVVTKVSSIVPPGRLNARKAVAAAEQRSRGAAITAEPWRRKVRKHTEDPELIVGGLVDISGSMGGAMEPMASAAWVLSEATRRIQGKCAMVYYGNDAFPVLKPGQHLNKVQVYTAPDGTEVFDKAFRALDGALNLLNSRGARLLVIVSDLYYTGWEGERTRYWMKRCRDAGVAVVVVPFEYEDHARGVVKAIKGGGVTVVPASLTEDVVGAAKAIGEAAVKQLEQVSG
jgi:hypothetical protein